MLQLRPRDSRGVGGFIVVWRRYPALLCAHRNQLSESCRDERRLNPLTQNEPGQPARRSRGSCNLSSTLKLRVEPLHPPACALGLGRLSLGRGAENAAPTPQQRERRRIIGVTRCTLGERSMSPSAAGSAAGSTYRPSVQRRTGPSAAGPSRRLYCACWVGRKRKSARVARWQSPAPVVRRRDARWPQAARKRGKCAHAADYSWSPRARTNGARCSPHRGARPDVAATATRGGAERRRRSLCHRLSGRGRDEVGRT